MAWCVCMLADYVQPLSTCATGQVLRHQICSLLMTSLRTNTEVIFFGICILYLSNMYLLWISQSYYCWHFKLIHSPYIGVSLKVKLENHISGVWSYDQLHMLSGSIVHRLSQSVRSEKCIFFAFVIGILLHVIKLSPRRNCFMQYKSVFWEWSSLSFYNFRQIMALLKTLLVAVFSGELLPVFFPKAFETLKEVWLTIY